MEEKIWKLLIQVLKITTVNVWNRTINCMETVKLPKLSIEIARKIMCNIYSLRYLVLYL